MWPYVQFAVFISMMVTFTTFFFSVGTRAKRRRKKKRAKRRKRRRKKRRKGKEETHPHQTPMTTERGWYIWNVLQLPEIWQITSIRKYTNYFYHSFVFFYWTLLFLDRINHHRIFKVCLILWKYIKNGSTSYSGQFGEFLAAYETQSFFTHH